MKSRGAQRRRQIGNVSEEQNYEKSVQMNHKAQEIKREVNDEN